MNGVDMCGRVVGLGVDDHIGNGVDGSVLQKRQARSDALEFREQGQHVCERAVGLAIVGRELEWGR